MTPADDQRWLAVLAGRAEPDDGETQEAAGLRAYLLQRNADEVAEADEASFRRTMNHLRANGAFTAKAAAAAEPSGRRGLLGWLLPGAAGGPRYALAAAVLLAVVVAPLVLRQPNDEAGTIKRAPPVSTSAEAVLLATDPLEKARDVETALIAHGVLPTLETGARQVLLTATVPPANAAAVRGALQGFGVALPADGRLRILVRQP